jgi:hypothetical protein
MNTVAHFLITNKQFHLIQHSIMNASEQLKKGGVVMTIDRMVLAFAGSFVLISLILSQVHSTYWLLFTGFVGANLLQSAFTGFCPLAKILHRFGVKPGKAFQ